MTSSIQGIAVDPTPPNSGEGLIFNGTAYVPTPANPGDITAVNTNLPLTGGGTSGALTLDINNFTGDAGAGGLDGAVPAPAAGDAAAGRFLSAGGTWAVPPAGGGMTRLSYDRDDVGATINSVPFVTLIQANGTGVVVTTGGTLLVLFGCDYIENGGAPSTNVYLRILVDGIIQAGGTVRAKATDAGIVSLSASVSGLAAGNHTVVVEVSTAGPIQFNTFSSLDTPILLQVWEA